jgi:hypothetical protein
LRLPLTPLTQVGLSWGASAIQAGVSKVQEAGVVDAAKDAYYKVSSVAVSAAVSVKERLDTAAQGPQKPLANFPKGKIAATGFGSDSYSSQQPGGGGAVFSSGGSADYDDLASAPSAARALPSSASRPGGNSGASASAPVRVLISTFSTVVFCAHLPIGNLILQAMKKGAASGGHGSADTDEWSSWGQEKDGW